MKSKDKVLELVEWIAKLIRSVDGMRGDALWGGNDPRKELFERHKNVYRQKAKQILSHPDLARKCPDCDGNGDNGDCYECCGKGYIPLAPTLKKMEDGH